jgi:hypothetical protein
MKRPRRIDQPITQATSTEELLWHFETTLKVAKTEAELAFQRQLENYEILLNRIQQIRDSLPRQAVVPQDNVAKLATLTGVRTVKRRKAHGPLALPDNS